MNEALGYLRRADARPGTSNTIGLRAKVVLAVDGRRARTRATSAARTWSARSARTLGPTAASATRAVFDDALAVLALEAAGVETPARAVDWLLDAQCPDGGWAVRRAATARRRRRTASTTDPANDFFASDSNTTRYVVQALGRRAASATVRARSRSRSSTRSATPRTAAGATRGASITTDANSTALVLQAYAAAGDCRSRTAALEALRELQYPACGAWAYTWDATTPAGRPGDRIGRDDRRGARPAAARRCRSRRHRSHGHAPPSGAAR